MNDLLCGRILGVLVGLLFLIVAYIYVEVLHRYRVDLIVRVAAAFVAVPTMGGLVVFQVYLFRIVTGIHRPLHSDVVFSATTLVEGIAGLAIMFRGALKMRDTKGGA